MNFDYVLSDEAGEIPPPKDPDRREKAMSKAMVKEIREQIYSDLKVMAERDMPLSPMFFRQLANWRVAHCLRKPYSTTRTTPGTRPSGGRSAR